MAMKFAAPFQLNGCTISYDEIDEFNIVFTKDSSYKELKDFIKLYPKHRINIEFQDEYDVDDYIIFAKNYPKVYLRLKPNDLNYLEKLQEEEVQYFFDKSMPIYSYSLLEWVLANGPTDIYIYDDLTYNLREVFKQCNEIGISLRIILNRVPTTNSTTLTCPSVQLYKPQDFDFLSLYYTTAEFDCGEPYDWTKAEILHRHWFKTHDWNSDLDFMNLDAVLPYPTKSIPPELTRLRSLCRHRCTMSLENPCQKCKRLLMMGYINADRNLIYSDSEHGLPSLEEMVDNLIISKDNNLK